MKLTRAVFSKYRKLDNVSISLEDVTILIGENNAGKSTVLEGITGATSGNGKQNFSRHFSKVYTEDATVRIFFKVKEQDLNEILHGLNLGYREEDKPLIYHEYELNCTYNYKSKGIDRKIISDKLKEKYNDYSRLNLILEKLDLMLRRKILFLKTNVEKLSERIESRDTVLKEHEKFPLNYLFYLQNEDGSKFESFNNIINSLFIARLKLININDQITVKVIQNFRNTDYNFDIDEMGDGFRKSLYMIV